jgi:hypothetical protein
VNILPVNILPLHILPLNIPLPLRIPYPPH